MKLLKDENHGRKQNSVYAYYIVIVMYSSSRRGRIFKPDCRVVLIVTDSKFMTVTIYSSNVEIIKAKVHTFRRRDRIKIKSDKY